MRGLLWMVFIALIIAAVPYADGYLVKMQYLRYLEFINGNSAINKDLKIEVQSYQLGWMTSHARFHVIPLKPESRNYFLTGLVIDSDISHGPIAYNALTKKYMLTLAVINKKVFLTPELQNKWFGNSQVTHPIVESQSVVSFDNTWSEDLTSLPITIPNIGEIKPIQVKSILNFRIKNGSINEYSLDGSADAMAFVSDKNSTTYPNFPDISIKPIVYSQHAKKQAYELWRSDFDQFIPSFSLTWKNGNTAALNNVQFKMRSGINSAQLYDMAFSVASNPIEVQFNDLPAITAFTLGVEVNNINPSTVAQYYEYVNAANPNPESIKNLLSKIATPSSEYHVGISMNTSLGKVAAQLGATYLSSSSDQLNMVYEGQFRIAASLLTKLVENSLEKINQAMITASMNNAPVGATPSTPAAPPAPPSPEQVAEQAKTLIDSWITKGYLVKVGDDYLSLFTHHQNELKINGVVAPMPSYTP